MTSLELTLLCLVAVLCAGIVALYSKRQRVSLHNGKPVATTEAVFLFRNKTLSDSTGSATRLLQGKLDDMSDWDTLMLVLESDFPYLSAAIETLEQDQSTVLQSDFNPNLRVSIQRFDDVLRITLSGVDPEHTPDLLHRIEQQNLRNELYLLRNIVECAPQIIWQEDEQGNVTWCNRTYLTYTDRITSAEKPAIPSLPKKRIFENLTPPDPDSEIAKKSRHTLQLDGENAEHWFNIVSVPAREGTLHYATDANEQLRSENAQKAFIQTFSKTFAQLSVGLAIFDRSRQLSMFNPALLDLSGLPVSFLSSRPSIDRVLDRLREAGKLPEPKDYSVWREQFTKLLDDSNAGTYNETWNLPDGQTLRVTGRPHPDGAIAFLFEDISAEISLTRKFRTEIETSQSVLDALPEAIAVFSQANTLVITNLAFSDLWGQSSGQLSTLDLRGALRVWKAGSAPNAIWSRIEAYATRSSDRASWFDDVILNDGRRYTCHIVPIVGGMMMVKFAAAKPIKTDGVLFTDQRKTYVVGG